MFKDEKNIKRRNVNRYVMVNIHYFKYAISIFEQRKIRNIVIEMKRINFLPEKFGA